MIDELSEQLSMDPIEFRLLNAAKEGTRRVSGIPFKKVGYVETLQAAKQHPHYNSPLGGPNRGRGVATAVCANITGPASAVVSLQQDGSVGLVEGSVDLAGSRTAAAMHVAEVLGIPAEEVHPSVGPQGGETVCDASQPSARCRISAGSLCLSGVEISRITRGQAWAVRLATR